MSTIPPPPPESQLFGGGRRAIPPPPPEEELFKGGRGTGLAPIFQTLVDSMPGVMDFLGGVKDTTLPDLHTAARGVAAAGNPVDSAKMWMDIFHGAQAGSEEQFGKMLEAEQGGRMGEIPLRAMAGVVPALGPAVATATENVAGVGPASKTRGAGQAAGLVGSALLPELLARKLPPAAAAPVRGGAQPLPPEAIDQIAELILGSVSRERGALNEGGDFLNAIRTPDRVPAPKPSMEQVLNSRVPVEPPPMEPEVLQALQQKGTVHPSDVVITKPPKAPRVKKVATEMGSGGPDTKKILEDLTKLEEKVGAKPSKVAPSAPAPKAAPAIEGSKVAPPAAPVEVGNPQQVAKPVVQKPAKTFSGVAKAERVAKAKVGAPAPIEEASILEPPKAGATPSGVPIPALPKIKARGRVGTFVENVLGSTIGGRGPIAKAKGQQFAQLERHAEGMVKSVSPEADYATRDVYTTLRSGGVHEVKALQSEVHPKVFKAGAAKLLRDDIFGKMQAPKAGAVPEYNVARDVIAGERAPKKSLLTDMEKRHGAVKLRAVYGDKGYEGIRRVLDTADKLGHTPSSMIGSLANFYAYQGIYRASSGANPKALLGPAALHAAANVTARIMVNPWGAKTLENYLKAAGRAANASTVRGAKAAFWGKRLAELAKKEETSAQ